MVAVSAVLLLALWPGTPATAGLGGESWYQTEAEARAARDEAYNASPLPTWQTLPYNETRYKIPGWNSGFVGEDPRCPKKWYDRYRQYYRAYTWSLRDTGVYDHYLYYFCQDGAIQCAEGTEWVQVLQQCAPKCATGEERNAKGVCESTCPVPPLKDPFPPPGDACTASLEKGKGKDVDGECPRPPILDDPKGEPCLADKIRALGIPYTSPSGSIRTPAYQDHLAEIWKKWKQLENLKKKSPTEFAACVTKGVWSKIDSEKKTHGLTREAPSYDANDTHVNGNAVDIPESIEAQLESTLDSVTCSSPPVCVGKRDCPLPPPPTCMDPQGYMDSSLFGPACNLKWGGPFDPPDPIHYQRR